MKTLLETRPCGTIGVCKNHLPASVGFDWRANSGKEAYMPNVTVKDVGRSSMSDVDYSITSHQIAQEAKPRRPRKRRAVLQYAPDLAKRDGGWFCHYCTHPVIPDDRLDDYKVLHTITVRGGRVLSEWTIPAEVYEHVCQVDHLVPYARGGSHSLDNLVLACAWCNARKGAKSADEFFEYLRTHPRP